MITLDVADLVVIGGRTLGISHDAALSQIDIAAAQAALTEARLTSGTRLPPPGPASCTRCFATARSRGMASRSR
jgi:hypothetical protein